MSKRAPFRLTLRASAGVFTMSALMSAALVACDSANVSVPKETTVAPAAPVSAMVLTTGAVNLRGYPYRFLDETADSGLKSIWSQFRRETPSNDANEAHFGASVESFRLIRPRKGSQSMEADLSPYTLSVTESADSAADDGTYSREVKFFGPEITPGNGELSAGESRATVRCAGSDFDQTCVALLTLSEPGGKTSGLLQERQLYGYLPSIVAVHGGESAAGKSLAHFLNIQKRHSLAYRIKTLEVNSVGLTTQTVMNGASSFEFSFSNAVGFNEEHEMFALAGDLVAVPEQGRQEIEVVRAVHVPIRRAWLLPSSLPGILQFELELSNPDGNADHVVFAVSTEPGFER